MEPDRPEKSSRAVRLPYRFGETVYLKGREDCVPGTVVAFMILPNMVKADVTWSDHAFNQSENFPCELTTEYEPTYSLREPRD